MKSAASLLLLTLALSSLAEVYDVSVDSKGTVVIYNGGFTDASIDVNSSTIQFVFIGNGGALDLNPSSAVDVNFTTPSLGSAGSFTIIKAQRISLSSTAGSQVFRAWAFNTSNAISFYYDDAAIPIVCGPFLNNTQEAAGCFNLSDGSLIAEFIDSSLKKDSSTLNVSFVVPSSADDSVTSTMATIALSRAKDLQKDRTTSLQIKTDMIKRGTELKSFARALYITLIFQYVLLSILAAYFIHRINCCNFKHRHAPPYILLALLVIGGIITYTAGIIGFLVMEGLLLLIIAIGGISKCLCCKDDQDDDPWSGHGSDYDQKTLCQKLSNWRVLMGIFALVLILFDIAWLVTDSIPVYQVYSRPEQAAINEYQPYKITKAIAAVYAYKDIADKPLHVNFIFQVATTQCGTTYKKTLNTDAQKTKAIKDGFITLYNIDMSMYDPQDYLQYSSVNAWFSRKLNYSYRSAAEPANPDIVSSPADCRTVGFQKIGTDQEVWLKGTPFTVSQIVKGDAIAQEFMNGSDSNGALVISRLSPQDYHRYHSPVSGKIRKIITIAGEYQSVNADAVSSGNEVLVDNVRTALVIDVTRGNTTSPVLFVAIGANCVGSLVFTVKEGDTVSRFQDIGYFQFGGSTVVTIYQSNMVKINDDITRRSFMSVETYLHVGDQIAG
jgi:phosphatidylserine decarboxylase precursor